MKKENEGYFKRLRSHAGLGMATLMTVLGACAGSSNKCFEIWWHGALFGAVVLGGFCWSIVLISNIKR